MYCILFLIFCITYTSAFTKCSFQKTRSLSGIDISKSLVLSSSFPISVQESSTATEATLVLTSDSEEALAAFDARVSHQVLGGNTVKIQVEAEKGKIYQSLYCNLPRAGCACVDTGLCLGDLKCQNGVCSQAEGESCDVGQGGCECTADKQCFSPFTCGIVGSGFKCISVAPTVDDTATQVSSASRAGAWLGLASLCGWLESNVAQDLLDIPCVSGGDVGALVVVVPPSSPGSTINISPTPAPTTASATTPSATTPKATPSTTPKATPSTTPPATLAPAPPGVIRSNGGDTFGHSVTLDAVAPGQSTGPIRATAAARHTATELIVKVTVTDPSVENQNLPSSGAGIANFDSVEVCVDHDLSRSARPLNAADRQLFAAYNYDGVYHYGIAGNVQNTRAETKLTNDGYETIFYLQYRALRNNNDNSPFATGTRIGFDVVINDRANNVAQAHQVFWQYGVNHWEDASVWGVLEFATASPSASPSVTPKTTPSTAPSSTPGTTPKATPKATPPAPISSSYADNLAMIKRATVRNRNEDNSPYRDTRQADLVQANLLGPRSDYLNSPNGNPEQSFPFAEGGQFRAGCEFSHFSYDDPLVIPGRPGAAHLHMFFGNTDVNAYSTYDTLINSGGSTCNGYELNRSGYWVPAMFDASGNVRIPERIVVYYKGIGEARGTVQVFPEGMALVATEDLHQRPSNMGGAQGAKYSFGCTNQWSRPVSSPSNTIPVCSGDGDAANLGGRNTLKHTVKFNQCWNGKNASDWNNFRPPRYGSWYGSACSTWGNQYPIHFTNLEYFVHYPLEKGETTAGWFLSSDIDPQSRQKRTGGSSTHGDWWGGWHKETNKQWVDNCANYVDPSGQPSGCGFGYLSNGGPNGNNPLPGPALKYRKNFDGPIKVSAAQLHRELCSNPTVPYSKPEDAAYCRP